MQHWSTRKFVKRIRIHRYTILMAVATALLMGVVVGLFWSEVEGRQAMRDRLESLNGTLDAIGSR